MQAYGKYDSQEKAMRKLQFLESNAHTSVTSLNQWHTMNVVLRENL